MGLMDRFKKKYIKSLSDEHSSSPDAAAMNLTAAIRHVEIMRESLALLRTTVYPKTFFSRYRLALREARSVVQLCGNCKFGNEAEAVLDELSVEQVAMVNAFLERCQKADKLLSLKDEITALIDEFPAESYAYFLKLLESYHDRNDTRVYRICSVKFSIDGKTYYYLSNHHKLRCGDFVTVPVGNENETKIGCVMKVELCEGRNAPFPVSRLKSVMAVAEARSDYEHITQP